MMAIIMPRCYIKFWTCTIWHAWSRWCHHSIIAIWINPYLCSFIATIWQDPFKPCAHFLYGNMPHWNEYSAICLKTVGRSKTYLSISQFSTLSQSLIRNRMAATWLQHFKVEAHHLWNIVSDLLNNHKLAKDSNEKCKLLYLSQFFS